MRENVKRDRKKQILAVVLSVIFLSSGIPFQSLAEESFSVEDAKILETEKNQDIILMEDSEDENQEGEKIQENQEIILEENDTESLEQENYPHKTEIKNLEQESSDEFGEEVAKLISSYDSEISEEKIASESADTYASRRLIVKGLGESLDFSSCGADIVLNGPDQIYILQFSTEETTKQAKLQIEQMDGVKYCEVDGYDYLENPKVRTIAQEEIDEIAGQQTSLSWGTSYIAAYQYAQHLQTKQNQIIVAVVDTGIDTDHPFFDGRLSMDAAYNYVNASTDVEDDHGHGTHVSGIVVDTTPNLNIKILPIKCMNSTGRGTSTNIANAIKRAADAGAKVINYSAVGGHSEYKDDAINYAIEKGATVVVASGNDGKDIDENLVCPAHLDECIIVGSIDDTENRAQNSNYGDKLDLVAPGVGIKSAYLNGGYAFMSGTSMAAPHVAGVAAMLILNDSSLTSDQIEELLGQNAKDLGNTGKDIYYGDGMVDVSNLIVHNYESEITKEATESEKGIRTYTCKECGYTYEEEISVIDTPVTVLAIIKPQIVGHTNSVTIVKGDKVAIMKAPVTLKASGVQYTSSNSNVVKITKSSSTWYANALKEGTATITATSTTTGVTSGTLKVTIVKAGTKATSIKLEPNDKTLYKGQEVKVKITTNPDTASKKMTYSSSNTSVATVSSNGYIRGIAGGTATITACTTDGSNKKSSVQITVTDISWTGKSKVMTVGDSEDSSVYVSIVPETVAQSTQYISDDESIIKIENRKIVAVSEGKTTIKVKARDGSGLSKTYQFSVKPNGTGVESISASDITDLHKDDSASIDAKVLPVG